MQGLILAAGMGKRLKELTQNNTKCMVKVNGQTLIERALTQLDKFNLTRIVLVVGYEGQKLIDYVSTLNVKTPIEFVNNPIYDKTNNIYSLYLAKDYLLKEDTLLLESDLIFEDSVLEEILYDPRQSLALVDKYESWMDGTCVKVDEFDSITEFVPGKKFKFDEINSYYKTVNIYKFSKHFSVTHYIPFLDAYSKALGNNEYYEQVLKIITMLDDPEIQAKKLSGQLWYEIDDVQDLDIASSMFTKTEDESLESIQSRYGGYWRYPHMKDFCYLVNPYYPPKRLIDELKASFDTLLTQYPSGMRVNSLLASKNFGVHIDHIVIGNGAAELIKSLLENTSGKVGFIRPTFEEYPNRYDKSNSVFFEIKDKDFKYTATDLENYFTTTDISTLVLINPDNPTGNYIPKNDVKHLIKFFNEKGVKVILDESFVDFAQEQDNSFLSEELISEFKNLIVVKSISKSYGVPGLRLGVVASSDEKLIATMKKDVGIWNINSFGEFYMQIAEKYQKDYKKSLTLLKNARTKLIEQLNKISNLKVFPSQANYVMAEILSGITSKELTKLLLIKYKLFIKDLTPKISNGREYVRIAVRDDFDNSLLVNALKEIFN